MWPYHIDLTILSLTKLDSLHADWLNVDQSSDIQMYSAEQLR